MALVVVCGQPCSGKSAASSRLADALHAVDTKLSVRIIDESCFHLGRNQANADMTAEKILRGVLRSEVDRSLTKDTIVIVDSLNNIKGYRYELWCLARASGIRYCVLFCDTEEDHCREWNKKREEKRESSYEYGIFEDLVRRFEKPDKRNRWDSPLFELYPAKGDIDQASATISEAVCYLTRKVDSKTREIKNLQPTIATQNQHTTEANSLYVLDKATQEVINTIVEAQSMGMGRSAEMPTGWSGAEKFLPGRGPGLWDQMKNLVLDQGRIPKRGDVYISQPFPSSYITLRRPAGLPELRSLRRTFIKLTGQSSLSGPPPPTDANGAKRMFVDYLNRELGSL